MPTTTLSTKGQIVIPAEIRTRRGWRSGTRLEVREDGDAVVLRLAHRVPETTVESLKGCVAYEGPRRTLAEMEEAIARGARESAGG